MNSKKGFTLMETLLAGVLASGIVFAALVSPLTLVRQSREYTYVVEHRSALQTVFSAVRTDLSRANGRVRYDGEYLILRDRSYRFEEDGVYREVGGVSRRISPLHLELSFFDHAFMLSTVEENPHDCIRLQFNYRYSSFERRLGLYE